MSRRTSQSNTLPGSTAVCDVLPCQFHRATSLSFRPPAATHPQLSCCAVQHGVLLHLCTSLANAVHYVFVAANQQYALFRRVTERNVESVRPGWTLQQLAAQYSRMRSRSATAGTCSDRWASYAGSAAPLTGKASSYRTRDLPGVCLGYCGSSIPHSATLSRASLSISLSLDAGPAKPCAPAKEAGELQKCRCCTSCSGRAAAGDCMHAVCARGCNWRPQANISCSTTIQAGQKKSRSTAFRSRTSSCGKDCRALAVATCRPAEAASALRKL